MKPPRVWFDDDRNAIVWRLPNGVPVFLYATFLVPVVIMGLAFVIGGPKHGWLLGLLVGPVVLLSVLAHEMAHMAAARREGIPTIRILIFDTGGLAEFAMPFEKIRLWRVLLAGPAANLAIGATLLLLLLALPEPAPIIDPRFSIPPPQPPRLIETVLFYAGWFNVVLGLANLLPAYPLDGGRILEEWLEPFLGLRRSEVIVGCLGLFAAAFNTLVFFVSLVAGFALWLPPSFAPQWAAIFGERLDPPEPPSPFPDTTGKIVPLRRDPPLPDWLRRR